MRFVLIKYPAVLTVTAMVAWALTLGTSAESAFAKGDHFVRAPNFATGFQLPASNGYVLAVTATSHRRVRLTASKGLLSATYTVPGRASSRRIVADFGALGRIAVRFEGSPSKLEGRQNRHVSCKGRRPIRERGLFRGVIRFAGERRFTAVESDRAKGEFFRSFRRVCKRKRSGKPRLPFPVPKQSKGKSGGGPDLLINTLIAVSGRDSRRTEFAISELELALGSKGSERLALAVILAGTRERVGRMAIRRRYLTLEDGDSLLTGKPGVDPATATVALPKPFSGTAAFRQDAGAPPTWTGSLSVRLPGIGIVPLTGEGFEADLCQAVDEKQLAACNKELGKAFGARQALAARLSQGSGSHSQAFWDARLSWSR
jgi:hypothetical protein